MTDKEKEILYNFVLQFSIPTDYVVVERIDGLRFVIHPKENCGHHKAHVHVESSNGEIEIDLLDFKVINVSGNLSPKKVKLAVEFVRDNQQLFIDNWNEFSNGVKVYI